MSTTEGSEDVEIFLRRIKELGQKRDQEDSERTRKIEEEILVGRKEREARRAERARSISPTKSSPASTPTASRMSATNSGSLAHSTPPKTEPYEDTESRREGTIDDAMERLTGSSTSPSKENFAPFDGQRGTVHPDPKANTAAKPSPSSAMPSRTPTLSWQRRPTSQSSDRPRSRPLSMVATENAARSPRSTPEPLSASAEPALSREQIAQSLASKDPAWFRQTADRGLTSPAYRRNQVEDEDRSDHKSSSAPVQMPGMSREGSQSESPVEDPVERTSSPSRSNTSRVSGSRSSYTANTSSLRGTGSPVPWTAAQKLDPPSDTRLEIRSPAMSPTQGRISPERLDRPASPTKGMGGFVQSAMMKRSDSVNKRWSVQSPPGLSRGNSVASSRGGHDMNIASNTSSRDVKTNSLSRDGSPRPPSRPGSSHSNATVTQERPSTSTSPRSSTISSTSNDTFVKPDLPASRSRTPTGIRAGLDGVPPEKSPPVSPSKTMDSRRWSPTKSSWLESALNKPESPKPKTAQPPQQPVWMSEINRAKQKGSVDLGRSATVGPKHAVNIGGLMRSPPPGGAPIKSVIGSPSMGFPSVMTQTGLPYHLKSQDDKTPVKPANAAGNPPTSTQNPKPTPASSKIKPETPPKKDFRAGLKPRQIPSSDTGVEEPEFKNVFGQLRRTKTQNYVAPDELKNNITRGKAALNATGGPKRTERKDEFKEAILKKKDDFKKAQLDGKGVRRSESGTSQDGPLPEALAKRNALGRSDSISTVESGSSESTPKQRSDQDLTKPGVSVKESTATGRFQSKEIPGGKLAGRFNPNLAELLARGPPPVTSDSSQPSSSPATSQHSVSKSASNATSGSPETGPQLTHMTKARARGPRRKAPTSVSATAPPTKSEETNEKPVQVDQTPPYNVLPSQPAPKSSIVPEAPLHALDDEKSASQPSSPRKLDMKRRSQFLQEVPEKNSRAEPLDSQKPLPPVKKANSVELIPKTPEPKTVARMSPFTEPKPETPTTSHPLSSVPSPTPATEGFEESTEIAKLRPAPLSPIKIPQPFVVPSSKPRSPPHQSENDHSVGAQKSVPSPLSVKNAASVWSSGSSSIVSQEVPRARSPIKLPTHEDEKAAMIGAGLRSANPEKRAVPLGQRLQSVSQATATRPLPTPPQRIVKPNPPGAALSPTLRNRDSFVAQGTEASQLLSEFFGEQKLKAKFTADSAAILSAKFEDPNIKTLHTSLYQLSRDGKKQLVPSHQERILFEGNIYLCIHKFRNASGREVTEAYYWHGDEVPSSVVNEAKTYARGEAKKAGGTLVIIRQGHETSEFFHALGGIIIIRRGSSNKYDSLAPHILCGRKHVGQIVFDEVDFSASSLCSGFLYLISTLSGKCFLWKGKGSGIDELSCARLIGMDFGLTGEIEEIEDGSEPESFLQIFGTGTQIPKSADHWRMKPNYSKYCGRLFCSDATSGDQITETSPFCQSDFDPHKIYVLDAFFEIYVIVGHSAQSQYAAFQNALLFAQEYGILAAGMEDRPFVPVSTVIIEGVPKDMKSVFRKWRDDLAPTNTKPSGTALKRGRSLRVLPLTAALEATRA